MEANDSKTDEQANAILAPWTEKGAEFDTVDGNWYAFLPDGSKHPLSDREAAAVVWSV